MTRQAAYQRRRRSGLTMVRPVVDPQELIPLLHACGVHVLTADPEVLARGIEAMLELWSEARLLVDRARE